MAAPDFKNGKLQLVSGFSVSDRVSMSCWLNITDPALLDAVMAHYHATNQRPGFSLQKKVNDRYEDVTKAKMFNDVLDPYQSQQPAQEQQAQPGFAPQQPGFAPQQPAPQGFAPQQPAPQGFVPQQPAPQQPAQGGFAPQQPAPQGGFSYQQAKNG